MQSTKILQRIYDFTFTRRIDLLEELNSFDFQKRGIVTEISFPRCLTGFGLQLSPGQLQILIDDFSINGTINIEDFVNAVKDSNTIKFETMTRPHDICEADMRLLDIELTRRRQNLHDALRKYDRLNNGNVPVECFYTEFGFAPSMKKIVSEYEIDGKLNYLQMQKDLHSSNDNVQVPDSFNTLARYVKSKGIDMRLLLERIDTFDKTGQIPNRAFISLISSTGFGMGPSEIEKTLAAFRLPNGLYDGNKLCQLIEGYQISNPITTINISQERLNVVDPMVAFNNAKLYFKTHRIDLSDLFSKLDDEEGSNGTISQPRLIRLFQSQKYDISRVDLVQIASLFPGNGPETVNYRQLLDAIEDKPPLQTLTVDDVLDRIRNYLKEEKQYLAPVCARYDREQSGDITMNQLISSFQFIRFKLMNAEVTMLRNAFPGLKPSNVDWAALCKEVDPPSNFFGLTENEKKSQYLESQTEIPSVRKVPRNVMEANKKLALICATKNIKISPIFVKLDQNCEGTLTQFRFISVLENQPFAIAPSDLRVIIGFYRNNGSSEIDYVQFCRDLQEVDLAPTTTEEPNLAPYDFIRREPSPQSTPISQRIQLPNLPLIVRLLLKRYKLFVQSNNNNCNHNFTLSSPFTAIDKGNIGLIPVSRVLECFNYAGFEPARDELETTINTFRDLRRNDAFNYPLFVRAAELELADDYTGGEIPKETQREVTETENMIKEKLTSRNRSIRMAFAGIAKSTITIDTFFQRLATVDLVLRSNQANALVKKYRIDQTDQIDWRKFCNDVDNCKSLGF